MSKTKWKKAKKRKKIPQGKQKPKKKIFSIRSVLKLIPIGIIIALISFYPRISVTPSDIIDSSYPLSSSFTITNNNIVPIHNLNIKMGLAKIVYGHAKSQSYDEYNKEFDIPRNVGFGTTFTNPKWLNHRLSMDERLTISIEDQFKNIDKMPEIGAVIEIEVNFHPWFIPIKLEKFFRFATRKQPDDHIYWYSLPIE
jgi:hypothetical protein